MMKGLLNHMRLQAMMEGGGKVSSRLGIVRGYDSTNACAKVMLQPENIESGWLPVASQWVGNNWGMFAPPTPGDYVLVTFQEDDINAGIITMRLFTDSARPLNVPSGEFWLVHQSGSLLKLTNDGKLTAADKAGSTIVLNGDGTGSATFSGALTIKAAAIKLQNAGTALLSLLNSAFATWAAGHSHPANGSPPSTPPPANGQTSIVQAE